MIDTIALLQPARIAALVICVAGALPFAAPVAKAGPGAKGHKHNHREHKHDRTSDVHGSHGEHTEHMMHGGMPGKAADATRTVLIIARDTEFNLKKIQVRAGETVRFVVRNKGAAVHEFTIGTPEMQRQHQKEMQRLMDEGAVTIDKVAGGAHLHSHQNSVILEPGKQGEVIWTFAEAQTLEFGCNIPGHYDQGMKGDFMVGGGA